MKMQITLRQSLQVLNKTNFREIIAQSFKVFTGKKWTHPMETRGRLWKDAHK